MLIADALLTTDLGATVRIPGTGRKAKLLLEVAVWPATVTAIGPVEALTGTVTTRVVGEAEITVAAAPLNLTILEAGMGLNC